MGTNPKRKHPLDTGIVLVDHDALPEIQDDPQATQINLNEWFDESRQGYPLHLEIGSGKGTFLVQYAPNHPETNFIGIEYAGGFCKYAADRMRRNNLSHQIRMLATEAHQFLKYRAADEIFEAIHVYFPDPWPKARHNKRRLIQVPFLKEAHRMLQEGAYLHLVTDHADYFEWMIEHIDKVPELFEKVDFESPRLAEGEVVGTNFERKYREEGRTFNSVSLLKKSV